MASGPEQEIPVPKSAQPALQKRVSVLQQAQRDLDQYMQGVLDTQGCDGIWQLDVRRMILVRQEKGEIQETEGSEGD